MESWDVVVLGAGCAGLTAGLYAARAGKRTLILENRVPGGQAALPGRIDNYPGLPGIDGASLMQTIVQQAESAGAVVQCTPVREVLPEERILRTDADTYRAKALILATGAEPKPLDIPGEARLRGRGVSYCATCDGFFFRNREVYVVGGGNSAGTEALHLAELASRVHLLVRRDQLRCEAAIAARLRAAPNISLEFCTALTEIRGQTQVEALVLEDTQTGRRRTVPAAGVFIFVGYRPASQLLPLPKDENGCLLTDASLCTGVPGVFAAGDVRAKALRQIVTAVADGAIAATEACKFLDAP